MKISELDGELTEHQLVTEAMKEMEASRRCFRMIGGVLVERTVGEVKPAVERNLHGEWMRGERESDKEGIRIGSLSLSSSDDKRWATGSPHGFHCHSNHGDSS